MIDFERALGESVKEEEDIEANNYQEKLVIIISSRRCCGSAIAASSSSSSSQLDLGWTSACLSNQPLQSLRFRASE